MIKESVEEIKIVKVNKGTGEKVPIEWKNLLEEEANGKRD